jgi:membrane-associated phospholipid phosphatase
MPRLSTIALAAAGSMIVLAFATRSRTLQSLDDALERRAGRARLRTLVLRAANVGTLPGEPYVHPAIGATCAALLLAARTGHIVATLAALASASLGAIAAHHAVKLVYRRPRPAGALARGKTEPAFPSGHTTDSTAVLVTGGYLLVRAGIASPALAVSMTVILAVSTGVSRVLLGWHWSTDVVGGWLTGVAVAAGSAGLYEMLLRIS